MTNELTEAIDAALAISRNFATAKPDIGRTEREHILGLANLLERAQTALRSAAPEGYRLVPVEPTPEMMAAYHRASIAPVSSLSLHGYRAMLAAAPDHVEQVRPMVGDHVADASKMVKEVGRD